MNVAVDILTSEDPVARSLCVSQRDILCVFLPQRVEIGLITPAPVEVIEGSCAVFFNSHRISPFWYVNCCHAVYQAVRSRFEELYLASLFESVTQLFASFLETIDVAKLSLYFGLV
jgi:hypothetical protein